MLTINDRELHTDVLNELAFEPKVDARAIGVAADFGVVTLTGVVRSFAEKWAAEEVVKRVKGVCGIANELIVDLPGTHVRNDTDIAQTIVNFFAWDTLLPKTIQVEVAGGNVVLSGAVEHHYQKDEAGKALHRVAGVRHILNLIEVAPVVRGEEIERKIASRFQRAASFDARRVRAHVNGSAVTLRGSVASLAERNCAAVVAWAVPGVSSVTNLLAIEVPDVL